MATKKSPEELRFQFHEDYAKICRSEIKTNGIRKLYLALDYLKDKPDDYPVYKLTKTEAVKIINRAIEEYKEKLNDSGI
jgi:hypothetical protein